jgi:hypothetical protein
MRREPSSHDKLYAWHTAALAHVAKAGTMKGFEGRIVADDPQCGWFRRRLVKNGPWVPARVFYDQPINPETGELEGDEVLICEVAGERRNPADEWTWLANHPISQEEYLSMVSSAFAEPAGNSTNLPF